MIDIPLIGFETILNLKKYNYEGVYLQKNKCLVLDKNKIIEYANKNNLFISSVDLNWKKLKYLFVALNNLVKIFVQIYYQEWI